MTKTITQRELRNDSGEIMRGLEAGTSYIVTRHGKPIGHLAPIATAPTGDMRAILEAFRGAPPIDYAKFRADIDSVVDQDPTPRA